MVVFLVVCRLVAELDTLGYEVVEAQSFTDEVNTALMKLKEKDTRVILGEVNQTRVMGVVILLVGFRQFQRTLRKDDILRSL